MAQHRLTSRRTRASLRHTVDIVDLRTGTIHLLTSAAAAGTNRTGRYVALCGADVVRADDRCFSLAVSISYGMRR